MIKRQKVFLVSGPNHAIFRFFPTLRFLAKHFHFIGVDFKLSASFVFDFFNQSIKFSSIKNCRSGITKVWFAWLMESS